MLHLLLCNQLLLTMKPELLKVEASSVHSFSSRQDLVPNINNRLHYHPQLELIHFVEGKGTQFIGDSIKRFNSGDLVLVGSNLPHYWDTITYTRMKTQNLRQNLGWYILMKTFGEKLF